MIYPSAPLAKFCLQVFSKFSGLDCIFVQYAMLLALEGLNQACFHDTCKNTEHFFFFYNFPDVCSLQLKHWLACTLVIKLAHLGNIVF